MTLDRKSSYGFEIHPSPLNPAIPRYVFYINPPPTRVISFKGGGSRVYVYAKFIEEIDKRGKLKEAKEIGGSSSGSIAALIAALHYDNTADRIAALEEIRRTEKHDIYGETLPWKIYEIITLPVAFISQCFAWISTKINWLANVCNQSTLGKVVGFPLKAISWLFTTASVLTSPRTYAGIFNLIVRGGVFGGDKLENKIRERIQLDTQAGLDSILAKLNKYERSRVASKMLAIGLCEWRQGRLTITTDVTFQHLYELSRLPGSQFKEYYTTAVRIRDGQLCVLNHNTRPSMPLYKAVRTAITFPRYFQPVVYEGERYFDGGAKDNAPVALAKGKIISAFKREFGLQDNMARLNVRVEYPHDHDYYIWKSPLSAPLTFKDKAIRKISQWISYGIDTYATDEFAAQHLREHYSQQTLQIKDFNIGLMEFNIPATIQDEIDREVPKIVNTYFENHADEKAVIKHYDLTADMPLAVQKKLLGVLKNTAIKDEDVFIYADKSAEELKVLRDQELEKVKASILAVTQDATVKIHVGLGTCPTPVESISAVEIAETNLRTHAYPHRERGLDKAPALSRHAYLSRKV